MTPPLKPGDGTSASGEAGRVGGGQVVNEGGTSDSRTWTLSIPAPADFINVNKRYHWAAKAKLTKAWRKNTYFAALKAQLPEGLERVHIIATITRPTRRKYDVGNLADTAKACIDGLVSDYGLLPDDDNAHLLGPDMRHDPEPGPASITLTIKEIQ